MSAEDYSQDIWDYLDDMPYVPSRADRDALVEAARADPDKEKRVRTWDYFFRIRPEDVGKPQQQEIAQLERQRHETVSSHDKERQRLEREIATFESKRKARRTMRVIGVILGIPGLIWFLSVMGDALDENLGAYCGGASLLMLGGLFLLIGLATRAGRTVEELKSKLASLNKQFDATLARIDDGLAKLRAQIAELKEQIPAPPSDDEIHQWLQEDIAWLTEEASERSGLVARLISLKDAPNPLCILGPAELQESERIPLPFTKDPDREKHLKARRFATLPNGTFEDFYGVYNLEFILVAEDMLGTYGCFFDFITGRVTGERTSEQYYHDVVAISTRREYREVEIGGTAVPIEDAPTFSMSLSSGERRQVTFASQSYFEGIRKQMGEAALPQFEPQRWARNPETAAENAIKALRARLRVHKGAPEPG
jgi:hypothetical protein